MPAAKSSLFFAWLIVLVKQIVVRAKNFSYFCLVDRFIKYENCRSVNCSLGITYVMVIVGFSFFIVEKTKTAPSASVVTLESLAFAIRLLILTLSHTVMDMARLKCSISNWSILFVVISKI